MVWDARRRCQRKTGHLPDDERPLFLVVSCPGSGHKPWYLLTSKPVLHSHQAWKIVFAYARRWQIEMSLRFTKSEMAFESPTYKLGKQASLAYAFSLSPPQDWLPLSFELHLLPHNRTVEPSNLSSTVSLASGSSSTLIPSLH